MKTDISWEVIYFPHYIFDRNMIIISADVQTMDGIQDLASLSNLTYLNYMLAILLTKIMI